MANVGFCGLKPLLFRRKPCGLEVQAMKGFTTSKKPSSKALKEGSAGESLECSFIGADQLILMMNIQKKIVAFRDIMDLAPCNNSTHLREMIVKTLGDLQKLYPGILQKNEVSENKGRSIDKVLAYFCVALKSLAESWMINNDWMNRVNYKLPLCTDRGNMKELGETVSAILDCLIKLASDKFDIMEEEKQKKDFSPRSSSFGKFIMGSSYSFSDSNFSCSSSPVTPKSVLPESMKYSARAGGDSPRNPCTSPLLWSLRVQAVGKLNPIDVKRLSFHMSPPRMESHYDKIEEETTQDTEMDDKSSNHDEDSPEDLVFDLDTTHELDSTSTGDHGKTDKPAQTPSLLQQCLVPKSSPSPSPSSPSSPPLPPPAPTIPIVEPNVAVPPPKPPPPSTPHLGQSAVGVVLPPPPPPPLPSTQPQGSRSAAAADPPTPPPVPIKAGSILAPPSPAMQRGNGAAPPPPPPLGAGKSLRPKATTRLKRSTHLGNLYRNLKGKVEGSNLNGKSSGGRKSGIGGGGSNGGKQGMADALAEITKRSSYFQQIEEDVQKYTEQIRELGPSVTNFKSKVMTDLIKFHKEVESVLENLTDESQVLSRFEGFPTKKLEAIRMAAALFNKLNSILIELQNWNTVPPLSPLLDKVERYFNKIKTDLDALERTKDEESKKFKSHNIEFDFHIVVKIKEAIVDVSSNCMELALKERREVAATRDSSSSKSEVGKTTACTKMLWRAFQFAFRVYTFAGGHDERADRLTRELAEEIENDPPYHQ